MAGWAGRQQAETGFVLRQETLPILPTGSADIRLLHISDIHLTPGQNTKLAWLSSLADLAPDVVVNTGDNLGHAQVNEELLQALSPLLDIPGVYVPGSNDYYAPKPKNPLRYFRGPSALDDSLTELPWQELFAGFGNWHNLTNRRAAVAVNGVELNFAGVDDPHLRREAFPGFGLPTRYVGKSLTGPVRIGVLHAPYQRVLNEMAAGGAHLMLAGHTHGGQICLPGQRALVTNCDLPPEKASGLQRWNESWLNISAGIGSAPTVPYRFFCPPEAVLLTLTPAAP